MSLAPGTRFGHYKVSALLGQGGMGTVYRATDTRLNRTVALKIINPELAKSEDYRSRLAQEARRAAAIDSPYVVKVWQYEEVESQPFISLELVSGENLSEAIEGLPKSQLIEIAMKIAKGLDAAHRELVIHRDLKPDNIKLTSSGDPKILDFGLALQSQGDPIDAQGNIEGTILYASPEQLSAEPITAASDLYSYGVILYEMFTGRHPFAGEHPAASMYSILYDDPASPTELVPDLPNWLSSLIVTLLEKQPEDRFPSACEVVEAIEANMESRSSGSTQVTFPQRRRTVTIVDIKNLSADKSWDYFCHGFTEDVITEVSRRTDMVVFGQPATAVSRDIDQAFESFRTDFLVNGSLLQWQETVRLSLNIYSRQDRHLISSKKHEGPSRDIFQLLSQAAEVAAEVLATSCGSQPIETAEAKRPDVTAYDYYLKGKSYYQTNRQEDLVFSIDLYKKALELAPQMAIVHAGLSDVYAFQYMAYYDRSPHRIEFARQQANRALE
ncbi:MAG: protein kinase, partial [Candidatus Zixiibacteriota bacterium]